MPVPGSKRRKAEMEVRPATQVTLDAKLGDW